MEFKGTKGEWGYKIDNSRIRFENPNMDLWYKDEDNYFENDPFEVLANAKLIASAPDLLEALQGLVNDIEKHCDTEDWADYEKAKKAINKALK